VSPILEQFLFLEYLGDLVCKLTVDTLVGNPITFLKVDFAGEVVEEWPEDALRNLCFQNDPFYFLNNTPVGEAVVVHIGQGVSYKHRETVVLFEQLLADNLLLVFRHLESGPSNPREPHLFLEAAQGRHKPSRAHLHRPSATLVARDGHGQSVGHDEQVCLVQTSLV